MIEETSEHLITVPVAGNPYLKRILQKVNENEEIVTFWRIANVNAIDRLGFTDHGPIHVKIVANIALRILRLLVKHGVEPSIVKDFHLTAHHAEVVVVLAGLFHDLGMTIHRANHEEYSLFLADRLLPSILDFLPIVDRTIVTSEILHAIISHRSAGSPFTIEGAVLRVADALDMSGGRSRIPFAQGKVDIHSLSALAIEKVEIREGKESMIEVDVFMNNSAGIFQVDHLLKEKLQDSPIEKYVRVKAYMKHQTEKKLLSEFPVEEVK